MANWFCCTVETNTTLWSNDIPIVKNLLFKAYYIPGTENKIHPGLPYGALNLTGKTPLNIIHIDSYLIKLLILH